MPNKTDISSLPRLFEILDIMHVTLGVDDLQFYVLFNSISVYGRSVLQCPLTWAVPLVMF